MPTLRVARIKKGLKEFLSDRTPRTGLTHPRSAVLIDELKTVGVADDFENSRPNLFRRVYHLNRRAKHFGLYSRKGVGELGAFTRQRDGGFTKANKLFSSGACGGDRNLRLMQAVTIGVGDQQQRNAFNPEG